MDGPTSSVLDARCNKEAQWGNSREFSLSLLMFVRGAGGREGVVVIKVVT